MRAKVEIRSRRTAGGEVRRLLWWAAALVGVPAGALAGLSHGPAALVRFGIGYAVGVACAWLLLRLLTRRAEPEKPTLADLLTLARWMVGALLLGSVTTGLAGRSEPLAWLAFGAALLAATVTDWVDGPLARRLGPTALGAALDIEADSWLTLWCAGAAVAWVGLPWLCLAPPLLRYTQPLLDLRAGRLPRGGGPWWGRVTGVAQMVLLIGALAPVDGPERNAALGLAVWPISGAQLVTLLALLLPQLIRRGRWAALGAQSPGSGAGIRAKRRSG
jgi:phosphatidylglycerophosphate synthase